MMDFNEFASKLENNLKVAPEDGPLGATVKRNAVEKLQGERRFS